MQETLENNNTAAAAPAPDEQRAVSPKSRLAATLFCGFLGGLGVHRFYVGKIGTGILIILTLGGFFGIWVIIDLIQIILGNFKDKQGLPVLDWQTEDLK